MITDYPHTDYSCQTYVIKDDLSHYDLNHLLALIESLLKEAGLKKLGLNEAGDI